MSLRGIGLPSSNVCIGTLLNFMFVFVPYSFDHKQRLPEAKGGFSSSSQLYCLSLVERI